ncbi:MAG: hypothetical protein IJH91_03790 [Mogibacterium sp.]|nr:hypothetical protein [Mogibacterium sp.]
MFKKEEDNVFRVDIENFVLTSPSLEGQLIESEIMLRTRERILQIVMRRMRGFLVINMKKIEASIAAELADDYARLAAVNAAYAEGTAAALSTADAEAYRIRIEKNLSYARQYKRNLGMVY